MTSRAADRVIQAQNDTSAMNQFIEENRKFIKACAYHAVHHFVNESDDEWSVALIAFHEAVQSYDESKGDFRAFAQAEHTGSARWSAADSTCAAVEQRNRNRQQQH